VLSRSQSKKEKEVGKKKSEKKRGDGKKICNTKEKEYWLRACARKKTVAGGEDCESSCQGNLGGGGKKITAEGREEMETNKGRAPRDMGG